MKKVVLVNDLSGIGRCSLGATIPVFACLKLQVLPVATAVLTNQTAYLDYRIAELPELIDDCRAMWSGLGIGCDGLVAGFFRSAVQCRAALELFDKIKNCGALLVVDPVMGDDGARYSCFDDELCDAITVATQKADIITPNFTEACILSGTDYHALVAQRKESGYLDKVKDSFASLLDGKAAVVVTGIRYSSGDSDSICNMLLTAKGVSFSKNAAREGTFSGAGDLFTAVFAGLIINGKDMSFAFDAASRFVAKAIDNTSDSADRREGLNFESILSTIVNLI